MVGCAFSPPDQLFLVLVSFHPMHKLLWERKGGRICDFPLEQCSSVVSLVRFLVFIYLKKLLEKSGQIERSCMTSVLKFRRYFGFFSSDNQDDVISSKPQPPPTLFSQPTHLAISKYKQKVWKGKRPTLYTSIQYSSSRLRLAWFGPTNNPQIPPDHQRQSECESPTLLLLHIHFFSLSVLENQFCCEEPGVTSNTTALLHCFFSFRPFSRLRLLSTLIWKWNKVGWKAACFFFSPWKKSGRHFGHKTIGLIGLHTPGFPVIKMNLVH